MVKIIKSIGAGDALYDFDNISWKDRPEDGLDRIKIRYPIATSEERWKEINMSGEDHLIGYVETVYDYGKFLFEEFTDAMMAHLREAITSYTKYSDNPIYKKALKELGWEREQIILEEHKIAFLNEQ